MFGIGTTLFWVVSIFFVKKFGSLKNCYIFVSPNLKTYYYGLKRN
jgi:hypothetical protein